MKRAALILSKRDLSRLLRDKAFLFMGASQLLLLSLSITISTFLPMFVSGDVPIPQSFALVCISGPQIFQDAFPHKTIFETNNVENGLFYFKQGTYDALLNGVGYEENINGVTPLQIDFYIRDGPKKATIVSKVKKSLENLEKDSRRIRMNLYETGHTEYELVDKAKPTTSSLIYTVFLPFFIVFLSVVAGNMMITLLSNEWEEKTIHVLLSSPLNLKEVLYSKTITSFLIVLIQLVVWVVVFNFTGVYLAHPILLIAYASIYVLIFISFGIASFSLAKERDSAQNIYAVLMLPSILILLPMQGFPGIIAPLMNIAPNQIIAQISLTNGLGVGVFFGVFIALITAMVSYLAALRLATNKLAE